MNVPTAIPLVYELDAEFKPVKSFYLADQKELEKKINEVKNQGKKKEEWMILYSYRILNSLT